MRIAVGSDHRGYNAKDRIIRWLAERSIESIDQGTHNRESVDYPDIAEKVVETLINGEAEFGILVCGTGVGMSIVANKFPGIRAAAVHDDVSAEISRRHTNANVLCLSADLLGQEMIDRIVSNFVSTSFDGGRHARRLEKIQLIEQRVIPAEAPPIALPEEAPVKQ